MPEPTPPQCFYLRPRAQPLLAAFHAPPASVAPASVAVLMLGAWGAEDMSTHRGWRALATELAGLGCPVLRVDLDGCGDSADLPVGADHWVAWRMSVGDAADALQRLSGIQHIVLVGLRLGALLAAQVAATRSDVRGLVLVAPVRSGKAYLKELRMLGGAMAQGDAGQDGGVLAAGFEINAATAVSISAAVLPTALHAQAVTVVDRDDLGIGQAWLSKLAASGIATTYSAEPGFQDMVVTAHRAKPAAAMYARVVEAVQRQRGAVPAPSGRAWVARGAGSGVTAASTQAVCWGVSSSGLPLPVLESVIAPFGPMAMTGILVQPGADVQPSGKGLLILNSSAERRVGPNRMWVGFARDRAAHGDVVVRLDMPGLGESGSDYGDEANLVYPSDAIDRVRRYVRHLQAQGLATRWGVMGLCSGGYHSFRLGIGDETIERVFALNTFGLLPAEVADFDARSKRSLQHVVAQNVAHRLLDRERWVKLLYGNVDVGLIARALSSRFWDRLTDLCRRVALRCGLLPMLPLTLELKALAKRRCRVHFVFSTADPGPTILRESTANAVVEMMLDGSVTEDLVKDADHVFSGLAGRIQMLEHLHKRLDQWGAATTSRYGDLV